MEGQDFFEYLELQGKPDMITKSELLEFVRKYGGPISDRQLTFYMSENLVPKSVRVGSRAGAYPRIVRLLLQWIVRSRQKGVSVEAIKELVPVWRAVKRGMRDHRVDIREIEYVARQHARSFEAVFAVPSVIVQCMEDLCSECRAKIVFVLKNGKEVFHTDKAPLVLGFIAAFQDPESGEIGARSSLRVVLPTEPTPDEEDPATILLGLPVGVELPQQLDLEESADGRHEGEGRSQAVEFGVKSEGE